MPSARCWRVIKERKMNPSNFGFGAFQVGFAWMGIMHVIVTLLVLGVFIFVFAKIIGQWNKNNKSPKLTVPAMVVSKRTSVSGHHHHHYHTSHSTFYYVTFQVESGDRMELAMAGHEFGLLVEGDRGYLTFQGTRYLGFQRS